MPKRNFNTLEEFKAHLHQNGATLVNFSGSKVPCILLSHSEYEQLIYRTHQGKIRVDTMLDIFYDGHDVFVDVQLKLLGTKFDYNFLLYANDMVEFFEALAESGMISLAPDSPVYLNSQNLFMIQLPKKDAAERAVNIIRTNLKTHS
ncbi:MAG: hypothetical protein M3270_07440 [Thermoproteota archaeon]|nr:hypothetical protein [Thermoproteota archaeon]